MKPSLIHYQKVRVGILDRNTKDTSIQEPKGRRFSEIITIKAQVNFKKIGGTEDGITRHGGVYFGDANGYLICYDTPTNRKIKRGDIILSVNGKSVRWVVVDVLSSGHYTGRNYLLSIKFEEGHS